MEAPAPEERMAVLEMSELPGSESRMDWAFFFGSSAGTPDAERVLVRVEVRAGNARVGRAGRRRAAPNMKSQHWGHWGLWSPVCSSATYQQRFLPNEMPLCDEGGVCEACRDSS